MTLPRHCPGTRAYSGWRDGRRPAIAAIWVGIVLHVVGISIRAAAKGAGAGRGFAMKELVVVPNDSVVSRRKETGAVVVAAIVVVA